MKKIYIWGDNVENFYYYLNHIILLNSNFIKFFFWVPGPKSKYMCGGEGFPQHQEANLRHQQGVKELNSLLMPVYWR